MEIAEAACTPGSGRGSACSLRREPLLRTHCSKVIASLIQVTRDSLTLNPLFFIAYTLTDSAFGNV